MFDQKNRFRRDVFNHFKEKFMGKAYKYWESKSQYQIDGAKKGLIRLEGLEPYIGED